MISPVETQFLDCVGFSRGTKSMVSIRREIPYRDPIVGACRLLTRNQKFGLMPSWDPYGCPIVKRCRDLTRNQEFAGAPAKNQLIWLLVLFSKLKPVAQVLSLPSLLLHLNIKGVLERAYLLQLLTYNVSAGTRGAALLPTVLQGPTQPKVSG